MAKVKPRGTIASASLNSIAGSSLGKRHQGFLAGWSLPWAILILALLDCATCRSQFSNAQQNQLEYSQVPLHLIAFDGDQPSVAPSSMGAGQSVATSELASLLVRMIIHSIPPVYHDLRDWNKEREVWDGVHIQLKDGKLITHSKKKQVKAGTWTRYSVRLVDPEQRLQVRFDRLEVTKEKGMEFAVTVEADLDLYGQLCEWARDVRLFSISARADSTIRLQVEGTVNLKINPLKLPPDVTLVPEIESAHLDLLSYRLKRVSHVGGDAAKLLGKSMKSLIDQRLEEENQKLVAKINRKLAQRKHKMTISGQDWFKSRKTSAKSNSNNTESHR